MDLHPYNTMRHNTVHHDTTCHDKCHARMHGFIHDGGLQACQSCLLGLVYALKVNVHS
jgi:hypothetical protein